MITRRALFGISAGAAATAVVQAFTAPGPATPLQPLGPIKPKLIADSYFTQMETAFEFARSKLYQMPYAALGKALGEIEVDIKSSARLGTSPAERAPSGR